MHSTIMVMVAHVVMEAMDPILLMKLIVAVKFMTIVMVDFRVDTLDVHLN